MLLPDQGENREELFVVVGEQVFVDELTLEMASKTSNGVVWWMI